MCYSTDHIVQWFSCARKVWMHRTNWACVSCKPGISTVAMLWMTSLALLTAQDEDYTCMYFKPTVWQQYKNVNSLMHIYFQLHHYSAYYQVNVCSDVMCGCRCTTITNVSSVTCIPTHVTGTATQYVQCQQHSTAQITCCTSTHYQKSHIHVLCLP